MSGWWVLPSQGRVTVDDATVTGIDCSSVPTNIYLIRMWESKGDMKGEILYNHADRVPVREKFTDISPYIPLINSWMLAAQSTPPGKSPPITLAQAQAVKNTMVNALFHSKQQTPFAHAVAAGNYSWDATDTATMHASLVTTIPDLNSKANELASKTNLLNSYSSNLSTNINNNIVLPTQSMYSEITSNTPLTVASLTNPVTWTSAPDTNPVTPPAISWVPVGSPTAVNVTQAEAKAIINGIASRTTTLTATKNTKVNAVNALTTVAAVSAYDITTGW